LAFIKDNFKYVTYNTWEKPFALIPTFKIVAIFSKLNNDEGYSITY